MWDIKKSFFKLTEAKVIVLNLKRFRYLIIKLHTNAIVFIILKSESVKVCEFPFSLSPRLTFSLSVYESEIAY